MASATGRGGVIALLTDFGASDAYVGVMKGVILRALPGAVIVDLAHGIPAQDVRAAAFVLESAFAYFPPGTVHVAVVDPGVGGPRRILAAEAGGQVFLGPDNGVLSLALAAAGGGRMFEVSEGALLRARGAALPTGAPESSTFHGRDCFAPLAALVAGGVALSELGREIDDYVRLESPAPVRRAGGEVAGEVIYVDGFGNLVTNLRPSDLPPEPEFDIAGGAAGHFASGLSSAYVEVAPGALLAIVGSTGRVEISVRDGSAARELGAGVGTRVVAAPAGKGRAP